MEIRKMFCLVHVCPGRAIPSKRTWREQDQSKKESILRVSGKRPDQNVPKQHEHTFVQSSYEWA